MNKSIELIDEREACDKVAAIYKDIRKCFQIDFVPNFFKIQAGRPDLLESTWVAAKTILINGVLPRTLKEMIFTAISKENKCEYCESAHLAFCTILGVDSVTKENLLEDIHAIKPARNRDIILFAIKVATRPPQVEQVDYDQIRGLGINEQELQEIIAMASFATFANMLADGFKVPIDSEFHDILGSAQ